MNFNIAAFKRFIQLVSPVPREPSLSRMKDYYVFFFWKFYVTDVQIQAISCHMVQSLCDGKALTQFKSKVVEFCLYPLYLLTRDSLVYNAYLITKRDSGSDQFTCTTISYRNIESD